MKPTFFTSRALQPSSWAVQDHSRSTDFWRSAETPGARRERSAPGAIPRRSEFDDGAERREVAEDEIGTRDRIVERHAAAIDPGDGQAEGLAADEVGELRLPGMENLVLRHAGIGDQGTEERAVRLVALGALGRADEVETPL